MRFPLCCLVAAVGCVATPKTLTGVPTSLRVGTADAIWPSLARALEQGGFAPELVRESRQTHGGSNADENTERDDLAYVFRARRDGIAAPLTGTEAATVLSRMKADFRARVRAEPDSEVVSATEDESYQERTLSVTYRVGKVNGTAAFKWTPWTAEGELVNRLEIVFREQPPPAGS